MRYHFITFCEEDYDATASYVLYYLKRELNDFRKAKQKLKMKKFIKDYIESLNQFFKGLKIIIKRCESKIQYYKIFSILNLSATLYPLIVQLVNRK